MIVELVIENFALIHRACLRLREGFTAISGETGVGKSLVLQAIQLVLGGRADYGLVRDGASAGLVGMTLDLGDNPGLRERLLEHGIVLEDSMLFLQRQISSDGKSVCRVNGKQVPAMVLRQVGELTVQIHAQHDHQLLSSAERPMEILDLYIGQEARRLRGLVEAEYQELRRLEVARDGLVTSAREREQRMDLLRYQVEEISGAGVCVGELDRLVGELARVRHLSKLEEHLAQLDQLLEGEEGSALGSLRLAARSAHAVEQIDGEFAAIRAGLDETLICAEESFRSIQQYRSQLEIDPARLAELEDRTEAIRRLRRKYGDSELEIIAFGDAAAIELAQLENAEFALAAMDEQVQRSAEALDEVCVALTDLRTAAAPRMAEDVARHLGDLGLASAVFVVSVAAGGLGITGRDAVSLQFSANPGSAPRDIVKIASGGEMARVMLAVQAMLAHREGIPTLIFDEVDTGLSGRAAAAVGRKLAELAGSGQVMAVSHLAQVVCHAEHHFRIDKAQGEGHTHTVVEALEGTTRIEEVARLLSGDEVGETALRNAEALLGVG
ncbi:MAG: DNA repair protein RecN [Chthonomonas sp.]|nr:DNA repair protein RecN [Chthonomonas sp.]